ncbi:hypothetical protein PTTG_12504 [Puccinia triticina 1-1 BBBD Race 1]|uniref:Uncharacterized protein n=1 Tax=Puccinia triticina (isolate 1-1 / race 1 (BBBD)) TaxID=630390 RepID=A0A180GKT3_PUCT1|nr:hypothetical protein PTTG_12504 [Puccinia triticina 1-1 BBBD Race 1]
MERFHHYPDMIYSDFEASATFHPEVREMEHLNRLMAESSINPRLDLLPPHADPHLFNESLIAEQRAAMHLAAPDIHELALLERENEQMHHLHSLNVLDEQMHLRDRELDGMHLMNHERSLNSLGLQLETERAMVLDDEYRLRQGLALAPGYEHFGGSIGYDLAHPYAATGMTHPSYYNQTLHYPGVMADPYYQQMASILPRTLPMFSDPYFMNQMPPTAGCGYTRSTLPLNAAMQNPFFHGIDHDYGYGRIGPLTNYGLAARSPPREYGQMLDDLYLYEMMLRLDLALDEGERILRWRERLAWEELSLAERRLRWEQMEMMERSRLGLGMGSFWGHQLGGLPINSTFGYATPILAEQVMSSYGRAPIMGLLDGPHYPLSSPLMSTYPMWDVGGLGVGARISPWVVENDMYLSPHHLARQENIRREYAERRGEIPPGPRFIDADDMSTLLGSEMYRPRHLVRQENIRREYAERRGEIPPVPRLIEPGRMGAGVPLYAAYSENYRVY